jgi:lipopolysaccharide export LptBFGC system permease protein LptF
MVIVIAAVFSLARLTRNNELIAIMASGVSLKRILAPHFIFGAAADRGAYF